MSKIYIIIKREFMTRVRKKSFILLTILMPFIFAALVFVPIWLSMIKSDEQKSVGIYDSTGQYVALFKDDASYHYLPVADYNNAAYYSDSTEVEAVIAITGNLTENPKQVRIYSRREVPADLLSYATNVLNEQVRRDRLAATGIEGLEQIINDIQQDFEISTVKRTAEGNETGSSTEIAMAAGFIFTFLIYMFVLSYGSMVMQSVMEEKTNRIVELMISSVKPFQLMMGKIIGIALVGFLQLAIWGSMLAIILTVVSVCFGAPVVTDTAAGNAMMGQDMTGSAAAIAAASEGDGLVAALLNLPYLELGVLFVLYFIGGYLLYASFFAAVGASVNEQEDSSQFIMPVMLIMVFALYAAMGSAQNTDGPLAFWASLFPLTAPIVMMVRIPFGVPLWQELLSVGLLYATALGFVWLSAKIYRVGILMYGKKPTIKEMIKWVRYK